jgi:hypothetical protein
MGRHLKVLELCTHQRRIKDLDLVGWLILEQTTQENLVWISLVGANPQEKVKI